MTSPAPSSPEQNVAKPGPAPTFQEKTTIFFRQALTEICRQVPELESVVVLLDWKGGLNQVCQPFLWANSTSRSRLDQLAPAMTMLEQTQKFVLALSGIIQQSLDALRKEAADAHEQAGKQRDGASPQPSSGPGRPDAPAQDS
jgi:hypothetical protein